MAKWVPIALELKEKILKSIKQDWISAYKASQEYWIWVKSIYNWLNKSITENNWEKISYAEISRLKKDKEDLLLIIWELTKEVKDLKKNQNLGNRFSKKTS